MILLLLGFPGGSDGKESACSAGDLGSTPGSGRSSGERKGNPLQYSCVENPTERSLVRYSGKESQRVQHDWGTFTHSLNCYYYMSNSTERPTHCSLAKTRTLSNEWTVSFSLQKRPLVVGWGIFLNWSSIHIYKITHFRVNPLVAFGAFTMLCNHCFNLVPEHCHHPKKKATAIKQLLPISPPLSSWQPPVCFLSLDGIFGVFHIDVAFCVWLLPLSIMFSRFIHIVPCISVTFLFTAE